jgi:N-acetylglucosaminyldiphosphoundecaprenol N-acetyl-beta-D-mannosaminyltransferase
MVCPTRVKILNTEIDILTLAEVLAAAETAVTQGRRLRIVTANPEILVLAERDADLAAILRDADIVTPDGVGVVLAARLLGHPLPERVTGIDLTEALLQRGDNLGWRFFFLGGQPGRAEKAATLQKERYPRLTLDAYHGYFTEAEEFGLLRRLQEFAPQVLLVGLGAPKQEQWLTSHPDLALLSMGVGGSFDVLSAHIQRAPLWMRRSGLEWLYRLLREPSRLKRQMVLPVFLLKVLFSPKNQ